MCAGRGEAADLPPNFTEPPVLKLSLRDALDAALDNNPNVKLFREKIEAARGVSRTQLGALLPNLTSTARWNAQTFFLGTIGIQPVRTDPFNITDGRGNLTQSIFSWSLIERWRASRAALRVAEQESEITRNDTLATAALHYMEVLRHEETVAAREANVDLYKELVSYIKSRQTGGMATGLDTARMETQLENERQRLEVARNDVERAKLALINSLGINFDVKLVLTDQLKATDDPVPSQIQAMEAAMGNRPELKAQQQRLKVAGLSLSSIQGEQLPSLQATGDYGAIGNKWNSTLGTYNVGVALTVPIFDGGQRLGRISESRSLLQQEQYKMVLVTNQVTLELREALVTLISAKDQLKIAKDGLKAAFTEVQLARERFRVLSSNSLELSNALFSLVRARDNLVDALFRVNASRVNLARAQGKLEEVY
jgi:outer membrane protein TolC